MEKFGRILLFCINTLINIFLVFIIIFGLIWVITGTPPTQSIRNSFNWIETSWNKLWGYESKALPSAMGKNQFKRAHQHLHTQKIIEKEDGIIVEPIRQPYNK